MTLASSNCRLNPASRELFRDGRAVPIEPKAFDLLMYLVRNRDRAIGKDELQDKVWGTVEIVLEGSVRRSGDRVRVAMQLIDAQDDAHLWSEIYDRKLTDIFAVQSDIAREVVSALGSGEAPNIPTYRATDNPEAYDYYLRGLQFYHLMDRGCMLHSRQMFERAIEIDPDYAKAWAGLANAASMTYMWYERTDELLELADRASRRALELEPMLAESHTARAFALTLLGSFDAANEEFERALELDPQLYEAWYLYARSRFAEGNHPEAVRLFEQAGRVRPDDIGVLHNAGCFYAATGDVERALDLFERRLELGDIYQEWIDNDSDFDSIRDDPRFLAMLKKRRVK